MKTRNKMKKLEQEKFVIPKTVQNVIPIKAVYKDGIFLVGKNMYSKTFLFTDVNYYIACENEKNDLMRQYWAVSILSETVLPLSSQSTIIYLIRKILKIQSYAVLL